ncbi:MAG TPA: hypothetical protein ENN17_12960 [bacterium]|nr:hypothetical protein [bacterium]
MEASLLFFPAGALVYFTYRFVPTASGKLRAGAGCLVSVLVSWICWIFGATRLPGFFFPGWMIAVFGILGGCLLVFAYEKRMFLESGLRYSATILLALIQTGLLLGVHRLIFPGSMRPQPPSLMSDGLSFLLVSFLYFFGFAFPERFLGRGEAPYPSRTKPAGRRREGD